METVRAAGSASARLEDAADAIFAVETGFLQQCFLYFGLIESKQSA
jgi:hypothetical protein